MPPDEPQTTPAAPPPTAQRRRWWSLSLRGLMILVLIVGGLIGWEANQVTRVRRAIAVLERQVVIPPADLDALSTYPPKAFLIAGDSKVQLKWEESAWVARWHSPRWGQVVGWLRRTIGDEHFQHVRGLSFLRRPTPADWDAIAVLRSIRELDFAGILVTDEDLGRLGDCWGLQILNVEQTPVTDRTLATIGRLPHLRSLNINETHTSNDGLAALQDRLDLEELTLREHIDADAGLIHLRKLRNLRSLKAGRISDRGMEAIRGNTQLETLSFIAWHLTDPGWGVVTGFSHLKELDVNLGSPFLVRSLFDRSEQGEPIQLSAAGIQTLGRLARLETLDLSRVADDSWLAAIGQLGQLRSLNLGHERISNLGLQSLASLGQLRKFELEAENLTDDGLISVGRLANLEDVFLDSPRITDAGLKHLTGLTRLSTIGLRARVSAKGIAALRAAIPSIRTANRYPPQLQIPADPPAATKPTEP